MPTMSAPRIRRHCRTAAAGRDLQAPTLTGAEPPVQLGFGIHGAMTHKPLLRLSRANGIPLPAPR